MHLLVVALGIRQDVEEVGGLASATLISAEVRDASTQMREAETRLSSCLWWSASRGI